MWQRVHQRRVHRQEWIEQMSEPDAVRFGGEAEQVAGRVEGPARGGFRDGEWLGLVTVEQTLSDLTLRVLVSEGGSCRTVPVDVHDSDGAAGDDAGHGEAFFQVFDLHSAR